MCLAIYGSKCGLPFEKVKQDAFSLVPFLNAINPVEPFTESDCLSALECFDKRYCTFPINDIAKISGIPIDKNRRNGLKQNQHLYLARRRKEDMKVIGLPMKAPEGRPKGSGTAEQKVKAWREQHPDGKKIDCYRETKLSRMTIDKWWQAKG